jgi:hypothetical protein
MYQFLFFSLTKIRRKVRNFRKTKEMCTLFVEIRRTSAILLTAIICRACNKRRWTKSIEKID